MRVLLIAPRTDLLYSDAEVQSILRSGLSVTPRLGNVGHDDVLADIDAENYDVFWFCGHATEAGLLLTDGPLTAEEFIPMIRGRFALVVLNSCNNQYVAQAIQNETEATVIATVLDAPDHLAFSTGALFARELARTGNIFNAYHAARPGNNRVYVCLAGVENVKIAPNSIEERLDRLEVAQQQMQRTLTRIVSLMDGDPSYHIVGMPDQLAAYIKANEDWKAATEQRIVGAEGKIGALEGHRNTLVLSWSSAIFLVIIGSLCLIVAFLVLTWLQQAG